MHRFFTSESAREDRQITLTGPPAHQIARVLRLRAGEEIVLIPEDAPGGAEWLVRLDAVETRAVRGTVIAQRPALAEPRCAVTLVPALVKGERFDWLLQKATELGAAAIQPVVTQRTVRRMDKGDRAGMERWRRIVTEAAEQSGRGRIPHLHPPIPLGELPLRGYDSVLVAHEGVSVRTIAGTLARDVSSVVLLIGPEGGFAEDEIDRLATRGALPVSLGPRILRAETAAITALTLTLAATGDLEPDPPCEWTDLDGTA